MVWSPGFKRDQFASASDLIIPLVMAVLFFFADCENLDCNQGEEADRLHAGQVLFVRETLSSGAECS